MFSIDMYLKIEHLFVVVTYMYSYMYMYMYMYMYLCRLFMCRTAEMGEDVVMRIRPPRFINPVLVTVTVFHVNPYTICTCTRTKYSLFIASTLYIYMYMPVHVM